jgi:hypothetical protein
MTQRQVIAEVLLLSQPLRQRAAVAVGLPCLSALLLVEAAGLAVAVQAVLCRQVTEEQEMFHQ